MLEHNLNATGKCSICGKQIVLDINIDESGHGSVELEGRGQIYFITNVTGYVIEK